MSKVLVQTYFSIPKRFSYPHCANKKKLKIWNQGQGFGSFKMMCLFTKKAYQVQEILKIVQ